MNLYQWWTLTSRCQIEIATICLFILECKTYYEPIGCFADNQNKPRPMPHYISTDRDYTLPIFSGTLIDWKHWNTFSPEMICRCATLAKTKKHKLFSVQFWGTNKICLNYKTLVSTVQKKRSFPLKISLVNVNKPRENCRFTHVY